MQHPAVFAFGAIFLLLTVSGLLLAVGAAQQRPLPTDATYTSQTSVVNKTTGMVAGFEVGAVDLMVPVLVLLLFCFPVAVLVFVFGRRRG